MTLLLNALLTTELMFFSTVKGMPPQLTSHGHQEFFNFVSSTRKTAMNLSAILANVNTKFSGSTGQSTQSSTTTATSKVTAASSPLDKANERIQKQVDSTNAQLSKLGMVKSSVAGLQTQSKLLSNLPADMSVADVTTSMAKFFNAYNYAVSSANLASSVADGTPSTASARKAAIDLRRALSADSEVSSAMKKVGLKISSNGTLTQDAKVFADAFSKDPAALRSAMKSIGTKATTASDRELAKSGSLESTVSSLNQRGTLLAMQQKAIKAYAS